MLKMLTGVAFGFFTIPAIVTLAGAVIGSILGATKLYAKLNIDGADYGTGFWGFVGVAILLAVVLVRFDIG